MNNGWDEIVITEAETLDEVTHCVCGTEAVPGVRFMAWTGPSGGWAIKCEPCWYKEVETVF